MKRSLLGIAMGLAVAATVANAQSIVPVAKPVSFGVAGGLSVPTGDFGQASKSGYNLAALLEYKGPMWPVALRVEGQWQQFDFKNNVPGSTKVIGGLASLLYYIPARGMVRPYVVGGAGVFNLKDDFGSNCGLSTCSSSQTKFGYDFGLGFRFQLSGLSTFVEGNWQSVQTDVSSAHMFPIRVGIMF